MSKPNDTPQKWSLKPSPYFKPPSTPQNQAHPAPARISKVSSERFPTQPRSLYSDPSSDQYLGYKSSQGWTGKELPAVAPLERGEKTDHRAIVGTKDPELEQDAAKKRRGPRRPQHATPQRKLHSVALSHCDSFMHRPPSPHRSRPLAMSHKGRYMDDELRMSGLDEESETFLDIQLPQLTRPSANTAESRAEIPSYEREDDQNHTAELFKGDKRNPSRASSTSECSSDSQSPSGSQSDHTREMVLARRRQDSPSLANDRLAFSPEHQRLLEGIDLTEFINSGQLDVTFGNRVLKCSQLEFEAIGEELSARYAALIQKIIQGVCRRAVSHANSSNALSSHQEYLRDRAERIRATHERLQREGDILCARVAAVLPNPK